MNKYYDRKKQVRIISCIIIIITLLIVIGSLCIYLYVNSDYEKSNKGIKITEKTTSTQETTKNHITSIIGTTTTITTTTEKLKYEVVNSNSYYPNSLGDWENNIANLINQYREDNGLNELKVSVELREMAETIADNDLINNNITKNKFIVYKDANIGYSTGYKELYNYAIEEINFKSLKKIEWMGIGVIYKNNTHYFCLVYE